MSLRSESLDQPPPTSKPPSTPSAHTPRQLLQFFGETVKIDQRFDDVVQDMYRSPHYQELQQRDTDAEFGVVDKISYKLENAIAADPSVPFYILTFLSAVFTFILGLVWSRLVKEGEQDGAHDDTEDFWGAIFMTFQVLITGGYDSSILKPDERFIFFLMIMVGVLVVSVLIGLITDSVNGYMEGLTEGSSKVVESEHTLILGWNEATPRVICQIAFLRRTWQILNERWDRRLFPWLRVPPSTPVAAAPVVVLWDWLPKEEMEELTREAFSERGITGERTKVGRDVIFRKGDPCSAHDLVRVAAHEATSIMIMMTDRDKKEEADSAVDDNPSIVNSATIRCLLSLRNLLFSNGIPHETFTAGLRVVVQLHDSCPFIDAASFIDRDGQKCVFPQDLTLYLNTMMFKCAAQPGLSRVLLSIMDFSKASIRTRSALETHAGPNNEKGWMVNKTVEECLLDHCWEHGSIMIGVDDALKNEFDHADDKDGYNSPGAPGIMSDPQRRIRNDDQIIFLSRTSNPQSYSAPQTFIKAGEQLKEDPSRDVQKRASFSEPEPVHLLLCGWRSEWTKDMSRFKNRLAECSMNLPLKSTVTCVNVFTHEDFKSLIAHDTKKLGFSGKESWTNTSFPHVTLLHHQADPVNYHQVEALFIGEFGKEYNSAICLGTVVGKDPPPESRDARILSMILILRQLTRDHKTPMHIIAENQQDQTSQIAMAPKVGTGGNEPDFINTQAIVARSLVMNLAYPQIQDAVSEFFGTGAGSPDMQIIKAYELGIVDRTCMFGILQAMINKIYFGRGIIIGYLNGPNMKLCVPLEEVITWTEHHRIVCIIRKGLEGGSRF